MHWFWRATIAAVVTSCYGAFASFHGRMYPTHRWVFDRVLEFTSWSMPWFDRYDESIGWALAYVLPFCMITLGVYGLLTHFLGAKIDGRLRCRECGYLLLGLTEPRCPECGTPFDPGGQRTDQAQSAGWARRKWRWVAWPLWTALMVLLGLGFGLGYARHQVAKPAVSLWPAQWKVKYNSGLSKSIREVDAQKSATDSDLQRLRDSASLETLRLDLTQVTDMGLAHLKGLTHLKSLNLSGTRITDAGLVNLENLTNLEALWLVQRIDTKPPQPQLTDEGLRHLKGLTKLRALYLNGQAITDQGLAHLEDLTRLEKLFLYGCRITDQGLIRLGHLTKLTSLDIGESRVTDEGLAYVGTLRELRSLQLGDTGITDLGLEHLKGLSNLRELRVTGTQVTDEGVEGLQRALPQLRVTGP